MSSIRSRFKGFQQAAALIVVPSERANHSSSRRSSQNKSDIHRHQDYDNVTKNNSLLIDELVDCDAGGLDRSGGRTSGKTSLQGTLDYDSNNNNNNNNKNHNNKPTPNNNNNNQNDNNDQQEERQNHSKPTDNGDLSGATGPAMIDSEDKAGDNGNDAEDDDDDVVFLAVCPISATTRGQLSQGNVKM